MSSSAGGAAVRSARNRGRKQRSTRCVPENLAQSVVMTMTEGHGNRALEGTGDYVDIREMLPGHYYRVCVDCGHEWWTESGYAERPCPECKNEESFREIAPKYAEKWQHFEGEDYNITPPPWYWPLLKDMARELEDRLCYDVNPLTCKDYILDALPEDHDRHETVEERRKAKA